METTLEIRCYQTLDQDELINLWRDCELVKPQNAPVKDITRKQKVDPDLLLVGVKNNKIIASVMGGYEGHRGWINYLAVAPDEQKKGYGYQMMEAIESRLKDKGCPKINLQVRTNNTNVLSFYQAIGYCEDAVVSLGKRFEV
ncbi:GNAT family acetyltransferase [Marinomonas agarivorans]|nr:GNAT family acetyltransferase [Marinomonas agarivorans]